MLRVLTRKLGETGFLCLSRTPVPLPPFQFRSYFSLLSSFFNPNNNGFKIEEKTDKDGELSRRVIVYGKDVTKAKFWLKDGHKVEISEDYFNIDPPKEHPNPDRPNGHYN